MEINNSAHKKNDIVTLEIYGITNEGSGVGKTSDGLVVFVPFTAIGDTAQVKLLKVTKNCGYGKLIELINKSPDRIEDNCPCYEKCGGCSLRHISYEAELKVKQTTIIDAFTRIGKIQTEIRPIIGNQNISSYRNKAQYPVRKNSDGKIICGFYQTHSHRITECDHCDLQPEIFTEIKNFILQQSALLKISAYDEEAHNGVLRHIYLRKGHYSGEINVCLVARRKVPEFVKLSSVIMEKFPAVKGVVLNINKDKTNVILGEQEIVLKGEKLIFDTMCENKIAISPKSFYQVNTPSAEILYSIAKRFAQPEGKRILDLYCGAGTIGLSMADEAKEIIGVDIIQPAIDNAIQNAELNNINNIEFICADSGDAAEKLLADKKEIDLVIVDPPRKGCGSAAIANIAKLAPKEIVMISCNPATAARDCAMLREYGYETLKVQGVDMFSRTSHVECVCLLTRTED